MSLCREATIVHFYSVNSLGWLSAMVGDKSNDIHNRRSVFDLPVGRQTIVQTSRWYISRVDLKVATSPSLRDA